MLHTGPLKLINNNNNSDILWPLWEKQEVRKINLVIGEENLLLLVNHRRLQLPLFLRGASPRSRVAAACYYMDSLYLIYARRDVERRSH